MHSRMAEDAHYASELATNKRKYEDDTPFPPSAPGLHNSVPLLMNVNEIELAKQKAHEIAVRLLNKNNSADHTKRPRDSHNYSSENAIKVVSPKMSACYGHSGASKRIEVPNGKVGVIIGKARETIKFHQLQSRAMVQVKKDMDVDPNSNSPTRGVDLSNTSEHIPKAELIKDVLAEAESGGSGMSGEQYVTKIPNNKVGLVIGEGGETIKTNASDPELYNSVPSPMNEIQLAKLKAREIAARLLKQRC